MLTSLNRLIGQPVVWEGRQLGYVERAVADTKHRCLSGIIIRRGIGSARWAPLDGILMAGRLCVVLSAQPVRLPKQETADIRRAVFTSGQSAGEVCDVIIRADTLRIAALEVSQGPFYRLLGRCGYACAFGQSDGSRADEVVVGPLLTWTQLLRQLGEEAEA